MRRLACFVFSALAACSSTSADDGVSSDQDITTNALASKKELFDQEMLFVRVTGWNGDPDALHLQKDAARLGDAEVQIYETDARSSSYCPDAAAGALVYKSKSFSLRTSGNLTNGTPKSSYKISLDDKDDRLFGIKDLNLKSMWNDVSQMRESIAWSWMNQAGITSSRHTYAKVCVDGVKNGQPFTKYLGLYSMIEEVEKQFFKDHFGKKNGDGNIYKAYQFPDDIGAASLAYRGDTGDKYYKKTNIEERSYQLKSNYKPTDDRSLQTYDDLATLIRAVNGIGLPGEGSAKFDTPAYAARLSEVFNVKQFLRWQALNAAMGAWDNYWATEANYYLYNAGPKDAGTAVMAKPYFTWIPWDYDNTFGIDFTGGKWETASAFQFSTYDGRSNNMANMPLTANLFANDQLFAYYLDALEWTNETLLTVSNIDAAIAKTKPRVQTAAFLEGNFSDPSHTGRQFTNDEVSTNGFDQNELRKGNAFILGIHHFVTLRHDAIEAEIAQHRSARHLARGASGETFPVKEEGVR